MNSTWVIDLLMLMVGLSLGSFMNVCIYRMPMNLSIIYPPSQCPSCETRIGWKENIPLLSFLMSQGKCRHCQVPIPARYPLVELWTMVMVFLLWKTSSSYLEFTTVCLFFWILLAIIVIDFLFFMIPDALTFLGILVGAGLSAIAAWTQSSQLWYEGILFSLKGFAVGGGILFVVSWLGEKIFKKECMGFGDVKLMAMIGVFLGWQKVILVFFLAPMLALPYALYSKYVRKNEVIPYGPFLSIAAMILYYLGDKLVPLYFPS